MQRFALGIEYDGANYAGWQRQRHDTSVQEKLESALSKIAAHPVAVICAGRTDAGVHATGQVIHFDTAVVRDSIAWVRGVNSVLPRDIRVCWVKSVPQTFNARRSATARRYCYVIANHAVPPGILRNAVTWVLAPLDVALMQTAATHLVGTHDFNAFRAVQCQSKTSIRDMHSIQITQRGSHIVVDISANAFLHHMVRNIVGTLIEVGKKKCPTSWVKDVLESKDRRKAGITAPSNGLYLVRVAYPIEYNLPSEQLHTPWFLA